MHLVNSGEQNQNQSLHADRQNDVIVLECIFQTPQGFIDRSAVQVRIRGIGHQLNGTIVVCQRFLPQWMYCLAEVHEKNHQNAPKHTNTFTNLGFGLNLPDSKKNIIESAGDMR